MIRLRDWVCGNVANSLGEVRVQKGQSGVPVTLWLRDMVASRAAPGLFDGRQIAVNAALAVAVFVHLALDLPTWGFPASMDEH